MRKTALLSILFFTGYLTGIFAFNHQEFQNPEEKGIQIANGIPVAKEKSRTSEEIFNNGPFITHPGEGAGGYDVSAINVSELNMGFTASKNSNIYVADNFTLTGFTTIESMDFFAYQANPGLTSPISGVYVQIYDNAPNEGGNVVWGDLVTNRLESTSFSNVYRTKPTELTNAERPIMTVTAAINTDLAPGTYWVQYGFTSSISGGIYVFQVTRWGIPASGDALQYASSTWKPLLDINGSNVHFDLPFVIHGEVIAEACPAVTNVEANVQGSQITLTWNTPQGKSLTGYKIYEGEEEIGQTDEQQFTISRPTGSYSFSVAAVYDNGCYPVKVLVKNIEVKTCTSPDNISVSYDEQCQALISWSAPETKSKSLLWDNMNAGETTYGYYSLATTGNNYVFTADDFYVDAAWILQQVKTKGFIPSGTTTYPSTFGIKIFADNDGVPANEALYSQTGLTPDDGPMTANGMITLTLHEPIGFQQAGRYWISIFGERTGTYSSAQNFCLYMGTSPKEKPACMKGNVFEDIVPDVWQVLSSLSGLHNLISLPFSLIGEVDGFFETQYNVYRDGIQIAGPIDELSFLDKQFSPLAQHEWCVSVACSNGGESDWVCQIKPACNDCSAPTDLKGTSQGHCSLLLEWTAPENTANATYNIYRDDVLLQAGINTTNYEDLNFPEGAHTWSVKTVCETELSEAASFLGECSSDIFEDKVQHVILYPNPANHTVNIQATEIAMVEIYNLMGQKIETKAAHTISVDVSSYHSGIYIFRIYDFKNNVTTQRIMITK